MNRTPEENFNEIIDIIKKRDYNPVAYLTGIYWTQHKKEFMLFKLPLSVVKIEL